MLDSLLSWNFVSSAVLVPSPELESKALTAAQTFQQHCTEWAHIPLLNFCIFYQFYSNRLFTRLQYFFLSFSNLILILKKVQYEYCQWIWFSSKLWLHRAHNDYWPRALPTLPQQARSQLSLPIHQQKTVIFQFGGYCITNYGRGTRRQVASSIRGPLWCELWRKCYKVWLSWTELSLKTPLSPTTPWNQRGVWSNTAYLKSVPIYQQLQHMMYKVRPDHFVISCMKCNHACMKCIMSSNSGDKIRTSALVLTGSLLV